MTSTSPAPSAPTSRPSATLLPLVRLKLAAPSPGSQLCLEELRLFADVRAADALEQAFFNAMLGAQHPSGRWWTYSTPPDGKRLASAHAIVFQARPGTPELNCCSVNGPRALGMLSKWALMVAPKTLVVNYFGPSDFTLEVPEVGKVRLSQSTDYPASDLVTLRLDLDRPASFCLKLRIPAWSKATRVRLNGQPEITRPGTYLALPRLWRPGDTLELKFDMGPRLVSGAGARQGKIALFYGPLLLAWDQAFNPYAPDALPALDCKRPLRLQPEPAPESPFAPFVTFSVPSTAPERPLLLCDFATAGALGTEYRTWLPAIDAPPADFPLQSPPAQAVLPPALTAFSWGWQPAETLPEATWRLVISSRCDLSEPALEFQALPRARWLVDLSRLAPGRYYWQAFCDTPSGTVAARLGPRTFTVDPDLPPPAASPLDFRPDGLGVRAPLNGSPQPTFGRLLAAQGFQPAAGPSGEPATALQFAGSGRLLYALPWFPAQDYTLLLRACPAVLPVPHKTQLFSAWCRGMDDPLRLFLEGDSVFAGIETAGAAYHTPGVPLVCGRWYHFAVVKRGASLELYVDGRLRGKTTVPRRLYTHATDCALAANPHFSGDEYFTGRLADFAFYDYAFTPEAIKRSSAEPFKEDTD